MLHQSNCSLPQRNFNPCWLLYSIYFAVLTHESYQYLMKQEKMKEAQEHEDPAAVNEEKAAEKAAKATSAMDKGGAKMASKGGNILNKLKLMTMSTMSPANNEKRNYISGISSDSNSVTAIKVREKLSESQQMREMNLTRIIETYVLPTTISPLDLDEEDLCSHMKGVAANRRAEGNSGKKITVNYLD